MIVADRDIRREEAPERDNCVPAKHDSEEHETQGSRAANGRVLGDLSRMPKILRQPDGRTGCDHRDQQRKRAAIASR